MDKDNVFACMRDLRLPARAYTKYDYRLTVTPVGQLPYQNGNIPCAGMMQSRSVGVDVAAVHPRTAMAHYDVLVRYRCTRARNISTVLFAKASSIGARGYRYFSTGYGNHLI